MMNKKKNIQNVFIVCGILMLLIGCTGNNNKDLSVPPGIALYSFNQHPADRALEMASSTEANYIEGFDSYDLSPLGTEFEGYTLGNMGSKENIEKFKTILEEHNLKMKSLFTQGENAEDWERVFEQAKELDLDYIVSEPDKDYLDLIDSLAGVYGVDVAIHEHAEGYSDYWHPDTVATAMEGRPNLYVCADLGHWARSGLDPVESLQKLSGRIAELHVKDISEFGNIEAADVNLGEGVIDWPAVVKELKKQNFKGKAYMETEHNFEDNLEDVKHNIKYFSEQIEKFNKQ